jgi:hypothetical protein
VKSKSSLTVVVGVVIFLSSVLAKNSVNITFSYEDNIPAKIILDGVYDKNFYFGLSLYPQTVKDAIKDGSHMVIEVRKNKNDSFSVTVPIDSLIRLGYNSSYELAFWGKKILAKNCTIKDCYWCNTRGYHLEELLFYQTGYFNTINYASKD